MSKQGLTLLAIVAKGVVHPSLPFIVFYPVDNNPHEAFKTEQLLIGKTPYDHVHFSVMVTETKWYREVVYMRVGRGAVTCVIQVPMLDELENVLTGLLDWNPDAINSLKEVSTIIGGMFGLVDESEGSKGEPRMIPWVLASNVTFEGLGAE